MESRAPIFAQTVVVITITIGVIIVVTIIITVIVVEIVAIMYRRERTDTDNRTHSTYTCRYCRRETIRPNQRGNRRGIIGSSESRESYPSETRARF